MVQYSTVHNDTVQYIKVHNGTVQYSTVPADHDVGEVEVVEEDLGHAHEHLGALHPAVVAPDGHLQQHSTAQYIVVQYSTAQ